MIHKSEYFASFLERLKVVGSTNITPENSEKYWVEHRANMTWGTQKALGEARHPRDVAILGAGKCNDIRLLEVMQKGSVENIDLYDLDADGLQAGINNVKAKIYKIMPEAINFVNFNPVVADITFLMKNLLRKFDVIRADFKSDFAQVGSKREQMLYTFVRKAILEALVQREIPTKQYDVVVSDCILSQILVAIEIQIKQLVDDLLDKMEVSIGVWEEMEEMVHELFIKDHFDVLMKMTRPGGAIFIASDCTLLERGKLHRDYSKMLYTMQERGELPVYENIRDFGGDYIVEELETPRFRYMNGDLVKMVEIHMSNLSIVGSREWEWNRHPHELQKNDSVFSAEKVQGVVLKRN